MLIERVWAANQGRNFHYLIACPDTREALAVDPLNAEACLARARELDWNIRQIFNTHEHLDHTGGNAAMVAATGAPVLAHQAAAQRIGGVTQGLKHGDLVRVGRSVQLRCLDTPGHTRAHLCLYGEAAGHEPPALFSGDTLFNAGAGNCIHGGDPLLLYDTFSGCLSHLPATTRVFPGHEYLLRNLDFTLDREPSNAAARDMLRQCFQLAAQAMPVTTLAQEQQFNVFFRLDSPEVIAELRKVRSDWQSDPGPREVFLALRELRNRW
ncbi:MAG TPA: hydroxyacylglutathione hydrolase C-terminal domain-containing protein [Steroidobacteraceae bacterium]|jgi:hydroxyacylglutathione hydrolase|nr:hydroxyacylglutathione hydrolase C-terminal domain-containing protein [Steroidobacteraceae bacterium]